MRKAPKGAMSHFVGFSLSLRHLCTRRVLCTATSAVRGETMNHVFVISDGTGRTAQQTLEAALTQFPETMMEIHLCPETRTDKQVLDVIEQAAKLQGFVVHTVVSKRLRQVVRRTGRLHNVETIDLMGPLLAQLSHQFSYSPTETPGLFYELNQAYFRRVEAMDFALHHDDGKRIEKLSSSEIVLVGVSRTFKTPLSIYLAFRGWLTANVPIVLGVDPPAELFQLTKGFVFGLTTEPVPLARLRRTRLENWGNAANDYINPEMIYKEIEHAQEIFDSQPGWSVVNVTNKPIEEIATEILSIIRDKESV